MGLLVSPAAVVEADGESLEVTYIHHAIDDKGDFRLFRLEGVAEGYQTPPEITLYVNNECREISFYYVDRPEEEDNGPQLCWETGEIIELFSVSAHYEFIVVDTANGVQNENPAEIAFFPGEPIQCSLVCGV